MNAMAATNTGAWLVVISAPLLFAASALLLRWGLRHLAQMQGLTWLALFNTQVTDAGIAKLNESLPNLAAVRAWQRVSRTNAVLE